MSLNDVINFSVITASSLGPVHIWNMATSKSEASFRMYNSYVFFIYSYNLNSRSSNFIVLRRKDEAVHANCVSCSSDGHQLYAATSDYIFLFDVNRPGRTFDYISTRPHFKRAIISAIATNPIRTSMFAVGTYNNRIGWYQICKPFHI